jgi:hypothetical protein
MRKVSTLVGLILFGLATTVSAQEAAPAADTAAPPAGDAAAAPAPEAAPAPAPVAAPAAGTDYVSSGLTLDAGNLQVTLPIVLELSKSAVLKPVWVPLALRYGITNELEVFLNHAQGAPLGPIATPGGVCIGGKDRYCGKFYDNFNIGGQFSFLKNNGIELAALAAFMMESLDASTYAAAVGVNFKYATGPIAVKATPQVVIGLNKRDTANVKQAIAVPVQVAFQATPVLAAFLDTGLYGPTDGFGDAYVVPVGIGASFAAMPNLDVGGEFILPRIVTGASGDKAFDSRALALFASWRLK